MKRIFAISLFLYVVLSIGVASLVFKNAFEGELAEDRINGEARLSDSISRLSGQLDYYRALINFISQDPDISAAFSELSSEQIATRLSSIALTYGASEIDKIDVDGKVTVSSNSQNVGSIHSPRIVRPALNGRLGRENVLEDGGRFIRLSRNMGEAEIARDSAIVMTIELSALEFEWPVSPEPIFFLDDYGSVLSTNRTTLLRLDQLDGPTLVPKSNWGNLLLANVELWQYRANESVEVQILSRPVPQLDLVAKILLVTDGARQTALLRSMLALAFAVVLGLIGTLLFQQRRRLALESQHSATLEARVEARTSELRVAQDELVEASNLAALGRLSAGLSHELNQPLAAILNFAENSKQFLNRERPERAGENLGLIADQVRRMTRIIGNLRTFARQEASPKEHVDLVAITKGALHLVEDDLTENKVKLTVNLPETPVIVIAGRVRLEQVIFNLVSNAIDAMTDTPKKELSVVLDAGLDQVQLSVFDNGPGVEFPDRVFEPFYTTKELGASKGLGMGLALSFGIIQSFDGQISCRNGNSGAEFTVTLPLAKVK